MNIFRYVPINLMNSILSNSKEREIPSQKVKKKARTLPCLYSCRRNAWNSRKGLRQTEFLSLGGIGIAHGNSKA